MEQLALDCLVCGFSFLVCLRIMGVLHNLLKSDTWLVSSMQYLSDSERKCKER